VFDLARDQLPYDEEFLLAALLHDVGKGIDPHDHVAAGLEALAEHIRTNVAGTFHPVGTCRMGAPSYRDAVTDTAGRVLGIAGLRVVDASIMPTVPRGNTNIPTIMIGEKVAAIVQGEA